MIRVGLLGCGNVGRIIAKEHVGVEITALYDRIPERAEEAAKLCDGEVYRDFSSFVQADIDIIVEAASVAAVRDHAEEILLHGRTGGKFASRAGPSSASTTSRSARSHRSGDSCSAPRRARNP
jgi:threonine dehydrogenase-like Zn-dependent dehydrogenase